MSAADYIDALVEYCKEAESPSEYLAEKAFSKAKKRGIKLDRASYMELRLEAKNGQCAICGLPAPLSAKGILAVDHNHLTGDVRGLLCTNCNAGLGHFMDNPGYLIKASQYLLDRAPVSAIVSA